MVAVSAAVLTFRRSFPVQGTALRRLVLWGPVIVYMAVIFYLSSLSQPPLPPQISDKQGHSFGYAWLGLLMLRAVSHGRRERVTWRTLAIAVVLTTLYGVTDELHQWFVPGREADAHDVLADGVGAVIGGGSLWAWGIIGPVLVRFHAR